MRQIKCLAVAPMHTPSVTTLEATVAAFNRAVSIGADEELRAVAKKIGKCTYILYAPDAFFAGLDANRMVQGEIISGVFYVVAVDKDTHPISLTEDQMMKYMLLFFDPEFYDDSETLRNWSEQLIKEIDSMDVSTINA